METSIFQEIMQNQCQIAPKTTILVGVSGGADSSCLLHLLSQSSYPVIAAHFNHQLRQQADQDQLKVQSLAEQMNVPFVSGRGDVAAFAAENHLSIEEAARNMRYRFLIEQAGTNGAEVIAVGHTADDQVETVLMHLLRGTGTEGLCGMAWSSQLAEWGSSRCLIRPLLSTWRTETEEYCRENGLDYAMDATNADPAYTRNRIRLELIPLLETYNPQARRLIWRTAQVASGDVEIMRIGLADLWRRVCFSEEGELIVLQRGEFLSLPAGQQRRILRHALQKLLPSLRDLGFDWIESLRKDVEHPGDSTLKNPSQKIWLLNEGDRVALGRNLEALPGGSWPQQIGRVWLDLTTRGTYKMRDGWKLEWEETPVSPETWPASSQHAWMDRDAISGKVFIGNYMAGDRFSPLGMAGRTIKVSDFFTNLKIPIRARMNWPILQDQEKILWITGCRISERAKITSATRRFIHFWLEKENVSNGDG